LNPEDPVATYLRELAEIRPLTRDEETALFEELGHSGNWNPQQEDAARRLIESQLQEVATIADKYSSSGVPMLELIQEGNIGLMKAVARFAEQPMGEFRAYAAACIEDAIQTLSANRTHKREASRFSLIDVNRRNVS
jgi:RNA polymerase primary sigma factor